MAIENGCTVKFIGETEEYEVSEWDGSRGWAGDEDGRGWYFTASQVTVVRAAREGEE